MKTTVLVAALAMAATLPLFASTAQATPVADEAAVTAARQTMPQRDDSRPALEMLVRPRFIGPYEVRHGLLPNGLMPNPFTYG